IALLSCICTPIVHSLTSLEHNLSNFGALHNLLVANLTSPYNMIEIVAEDMEA
ncbi:hypothetical protein LCGC14_1994940, partial [marine sediment metagenome]